jgi:cyclic beta-1,2-glucan synthetase
VTAPEGRTAASGAPAWSAGAGLRQRARRLAREHRGRLGPGGGSLERRLHRLARSFARTYLLLARQPAAGRPAAVEWLVDNDYLIQDAVAQVRTAMPASFYRQLPRLASGPGRGATRVLELARAVLRDAASADPLAIAGPWLRAYQEVLPLSIGELWAFPALLRLAVLEELAPAAEAVRPRPGEETAAEPEVGRPIGVLRDISRHDWKEFFEATSRVEAILREDPAGAYPGMTFATRDLYRRAVERIARRSAGADEEAVARQAVRLARRAAKREGGPERAAHVGTHLMAEGLASLEAAVGCRVPRRNRLGRRLAGHAVGLYLASLAVVWALAMTVPGLLLATWEVGGTGLAVGLALAAAPGLGLAIAVVNWLVTLLVPPRVLPRMDFEDGLPAAARTLVVMPVIVSRRAEIGTLLSRLEVHYLGNPDPRIGFALLTDFADAPQETMPGDRLLLRAARTGIRRLNRRHGGRGRRPFHLLHRERRWNPSEGRWMAWERKRGKLEELNRLLAGEGETSFSVLADLPSDLSEVRYVITLDADTHLPPGSAAAMVGAFAHPLNRPVLDAGTGRLTAGYTVLQPRLATAPSSANATRFSRILAGEAGLDLYTRAVSDVYHDLFAEAVFTGKGIYDVRAFTRTLEGRVPENRLLSHDLFEGVHGRVGLVSDVVLYEDYPPNALVHARRLHRWVRGDWQLLPWLPPRVPASGGRRIASRLSLLDRWKVVDNLRRSLFLPSVTALFVAAWLGLDAVPAAIATVGIAALPGAPMVLGTLGEVRRGLAGRAWRLALESAVHGARLEAARWALTLILLAYQSVVVLDAVARTVYRVTVSHRRLLEWTTAARAARDVGSHPAPATAWRRLAAAPALAVAVAAALALLAPSSLPAAAPVLLLWLLSPEAALWSSRPVARPREVLDAGDSRLLRLLARRTWHFFEEVVGPADHWLPPDHLQEEPATGAARRTSPTNVAMLLLSSLAAFDLGYLGLGALVARLRATLDTLERLERHRGHWFNWYDTRDLGLLQPHYVSTVDSGNLAAAFVVLAHGLRRALASRVPGPLRLEGLADTVGVLHQMVLDAVPAPGREARALAGEIATLEEELRGAAESPAERRWEVLEDLAGRRIADLTGRIPALLERHPEELEARRVAALRAWAAHALVEARTARDEVARFVPWRPLLAQAPPFYREAPSGSRHAETLERLGRTLGTAPRLRKLTALTDRSRRLIAELDPPPHGGPEADPGVEEARRWLRELERALDDAAAEARALIGDLEELSARLLRRFGEMDFTFLYDRERRLFRIGHDLSAGRPDPNHYDLLASEARIASFLAIAKGDAPLEHWLHLGRPVVRLAGSRVLLSWGGTMFEYLMPPLVLRVLERTLLDESCRVAVRRQIAFAGRHGIPWGISESGFAELGVHGDYQYRAFGVPGLGLKRDLGDRLVIAPYACLLALRFQPRAVMANVERLVELGGLGRYGLIEALDFGAGERRRRRRPRLVHSFMAHHQGMILVAAANHLRGDSMVRRLHSDPRVASVELLLHEQIPQSTRPRALWRRSESAAAERGQPGEAAPETGSWAVPVRGSFPRTAILSNGSYTVLVTAAGAGASRWGETALTRWRADPSVAPWGTWIYLQDRVSGDLWSAALEPTGGGEDECEAVFGPRAVELRRRHGTLHTRTTVGVAAGELAEVRRVALTNEGDRPRSVFLTSYAEVVLGSHADDRRHPAFSGLFVESEFLPSERVLLFRRRRRSPEERTAVLGHALVLDREPQPELRWETDRGRFLGRGRSRRWPQALDRPESGLTGTTGATLDPVMALGCAVDLAPGETVEAIFLTAAGPSEPAVLGAIRRLSSVRGVDLALERSRIQGEAELRELGVEGGEAREHAELLSLVLAPREGLRSHLAASSVALEPILWGHGISGDLPILLVRVTAPGRTELVDAALRGQAWWRSHRVGIDLVLLDEISSGYGQPEHDRLDRSVARIGRRVGGRGPGRVFVLRADQLDGHLPELLAAARVVLDTAAGPLSGQLARAERAAAELPEFVPVPGTLPAPEEVAPLERPGELLHDNGLGGFTPAGSDYVVFLSPEQRPPAPWVNVIANPGFGFLVSEAGAGCTWAGNSGENRLTPWHNDAVADPAGEAVYLRDEQTGAVWSPTPAPAPAPAPYEVRHAAGRTLFRHRSHGLDQELELFVDPEAPVKLAVLRVRDLWRRPRRLTVTYYAEWVLGASREQTAPFIVPGYDPGTAALLAWSRAGAGASRGVAFLAASRPPHGVTADRAEFLGPDGDPAHPRALERIGLSGSVRPGLDPCAALQIHLDLAAGEAVEAHFVLGQGRDREEALALARRFRDPEAAGTAARESAERWRHVLGRIRVTTPDPGIDRMLNHWLPYQAVACRLWGRTALYQSSSSRMRPTWRRWRPPWPASRCCARRPGSSSKATSSTGGIPTPGPGCARAARTTCSGCPGRAPATWR